MLAAGFVSYVGSFDQANREALWKGIWMPDIIERKIPLTAGIDPLSIITNDGNTARMISEGLPSDRISIENGAVVTNCKRWPLLIDPQTQGIKWLRQKEEANGLEVFQLNQKGWQRKVEQAITNGRVIIIENLGEDIDATMDPVLSRAIYRKGRNYYLRFGGEEVEYDNKFKLFLQTKLSNPHYKPKLRRSVPSSISSPRSAAWKTSCSPKWLVQSVQSWRPRHKSFNQTFKCIRSNWYN